MVLPSSSYRCCLKLGTYLMITAANNVFAEHQVLLVTLPCILASLIAENLLLCCVPELYLDV